MGKKDFSQVLGQGLLNEVAKKTASMMDTQNIVALPVEQIHENPDNRKVFPMDNIERLADTIEEEGFMGAIEVIKISDDYYEISSGHRRYTAMKQLGRKNIPCIIIPNMSAEAKAKRLLSSNINNRELTPLIYCRMITYYRDEVLEKSGKIPKGGWKKAAAKFFGVSEGQIFRYIKINDLIPELQKLIEIPEFPWTRLENAATLPEEIQKEIYKEIVADHERHPEDDYSASRIRQIIKWVRDKHIDTGKPQIPDTALVTDKKPVTFSPERLVVPEIPSNSVPPVSPTLPVSSVAPVSHDTKSDYSSVETVTPFKADVLQDHESPIKDLSVINNNYSVDGKRPFGDDYSTQSIDETLPVINSSQRFGEQESFSQYEKVPSEFYIDESINQLKQSLNADLSNKDIISQKLNELMQLVDSIRDSL